MGLEDLELEDLDLEDLGLAAQENTQRKQGCTFLPLSMLNFEVVNFIPYCVFTTLVDPTAWVLTSA